jgi:hypothetical protein
VPFQQDVALAHIAKVISEVTYDLDQAKKNSKEETGRL